ncbi:hypothetical protein [Deinococcus yavapaiensis]|uniref:hypothetical protein n=1 Tax=Deinococcus yavapaiensis TaxID=309889 RepID=UPI0011B62862|nr:hypothetical protein [Deinococcus yavapaiensis]
MTISAEARTNEMRALLASLEQYRLEEQAQALQEKDERRRAWHDGRASAYGDVVERLKGLLCLQDDPPPLSN